MARIHLAGFLSGRARFKSVRVGPPIRGPSSAPFAGRQTAHHRKCEPERVTGLCKRRFAEWRLTRPQLRDARGIDERWPTKVHLQSRKGCRVVPSPIARAVLRYRAVPLARARIETSLAALFPGW